MYDKNNPNSIRSLFDAIAPRYDLGNSLMSFHLHTIWNRRLVRGLIERADPKTLLDLCSGTGEIAFCAEQYARNHNQPLSNVSLVDFSSQMLAIAKKKASKRAGSFHFFEADAQLLPFEQETFDACSIAYGIRNVKNMQRTFAEVHRVLKPGGWLGMVELTRPKNGAIASLHKLYLHTALPVVGRLLASNKEAYCYLQQSIQNFVSPKDIARSLAQCGYCSVQTIPQAHGIATLFFAQKGAA